MNDNQSAEAQRILDERARRLAEPPAADAPDETMALVVMCVGEERYAVDVHFVLSIQPSGVTTPVPGTPPVWAGLMNVRGMLYAVLDLRRFLGLDDADVQAESRVVLVAGSGLSLGLLVDDVSDVRSVVPAALATPPAGPASQFVRGITPDLISVLDLEALLSDPTLIVNDEAS